MLRSSVRTFSTQSRVLANYGFVGLGLMGQHMARHVYNQLQPADKLYVHDVNPQHTTQFVTDVTTQKPQNATQLTPLSSLKEFTTEPESQLDFIVTMVPEGKHVKAVVSELVDHYNASGKYDPSKKLTFVDSSTIDIPTSREVHQLVADKLQGATFIDAPVSGGVAGARNGTLSFMVSRDTKEDVDPNLVTLLNYMGSNIFPCGGTHGTGLAAKLANNYLLAITNIAVADSFQLANSFGLNLQNYAKLVSTSTGKSWASVDNCPIPGVYPEKNLTCDNGYKGGFVTKLTRKDVVLATESAKANNQFLMLGEVGRYWYDKACEDEKYANRDLSVLFEFLGDLKK
ncbi:putative 3-hydroxyisobutyrate dehydrogenase, mitochondrial [Candida viswanathii]|uniref:3-hydroxyisobutyrate dehydrogenase n=1 Tax=Candida viswanathii TaxID=5486 RepID=A0A367YGZ9_9ASCO|nr:putative 3-hydroxyisobutyrate dehydrogenase, mitochondrial [Candida viswanathii]